MVETFGGRYVSLHVRVSNKAAIHLYRDTLGFKTEKTESKYYADGEDAFCMKLDLDFIREQIREENEEAEEKEKKAKTGKKDAEAAAAENGEDLDEGDAVGDVGRDPAAAAAAGSKPDQKLKVKVGRALGVGELIEKVESKSS